MATRSETRVEGPSEVAAAGGGVGDRIHSFLKSIPTGLLWLLVVFGVMLILGISVFIGLGLSDLRDRVDRWSGRRWVAQLSAAGLGLIATGWFGAEAPLAAGALLLV